MNIYSIFSALFLFSTTISAHVLTHLEHKDLQLLTAYADGPALVDKISRTKTRVGRDYFAQQLCTPLIDAEQLRQRQETVQLFLNNQPFYQNALQELELFSEHQSALHSLPHDNNTCKKLLQRFYFKNKYTKWLNSYPAGLECGQLLQITSLFAPVIEHAVIHFLVNEKLHSYLGMCCLHSHHKHHKHKHAEPSLLAQCAYYAYNIAHGAIHIMSCKELLEHVYQQYSVIREMQQFLSHIRTCLQVRGRLYQQLRAYPEFAHIISEQELSSECKEFINLVIQDTSLLGAYQAMRPGTILRAYALFDSVQDELFQYCKPVALIDFYYSIATLYKEYNATQTPYNFCNYHPTTQLEVDGFWNPLFSESQPIDFTMTAGNTDPSCVIVTGQNKAGKSTNLYAIAVCIVMGQSLGIAPAKYCAFSPFEHIFTGFNMPARVIEGASLFTTTIAFTQAVLQAAQLGKTLIILDELFSSTHHVKGAAIAQTFLKSIAQQTNAIALVSTHLSSLAQLQIDHPDLFTTIMVERSEDDDEYCIKRGFLPVAEYEDSFDPELLYTIDIL